MSEENSKPTIEYWTRDSGSPDVYARQDEVSRQLAEFEEMGDIAAVETRVWGESIRCFPSTDDGTGNTFSSEIWETYCQFAAWATENGVGLEPAFRRYEKSSPVSANTCEIVRLPLLCLAVYLESDLQAVFPHATGERIWTVEDGLRLINSARPMNWADFAAGTVAEPVDLREEDSRLDTPT